MDLTVQDVVLHLTDNIELPENTVDQLITGSLDRKVKGIIIAFMPTHYVIEQAIKEGANLIIAHESPSTTITVIRIGLQMIRFMWTKKVDRRSRHFHLSMS